MAGDPLDELIATYEYDFGRLEAELASRKTAHRRARPISPADRPIVVSVTNIEKTYKSGRNSVVAVRGVSFDVGAGEIVALTGPSGSGKSTVLNLLSGLDKPDAGGISIAGTEITTLGRNGMAEFRCQHIGFVFQFFYLQPFLTLKTNVQVPTMFLRRNQPSRAARAEQSDSLIASVGLTDRANHFPRELSGGQMQRAAIARALINRPQLVLADEPTGNLDSQNAQGIMSLLDEIRTVYGTAVIVVTHDSKVAGAADRVIELVDGALV